MMPIVTGVDTSAASAIMADILAAVSDSGMSGFYQSYSVAGVDLQIVSAGSSLLTGKMSAEDAAQVIVDYYQLNVLDKQ